MVSILKPRLNIDGRDSEHKHIAGYCRDIAEYVLVEDGIWGDEMYFRITAEECRHILAHEEEIVWSDTGERLLKKLAPNYFPRMLGAAGLRLHTIKPWPEDFRPCICLHGPYLYDIGEKMLYWHLYWEGVHYAAVPFFLSSYSLLDMTPQIPLREIEGLKLCCTNYKGEDVVICYGKEVDEFEGMEEWQTLYDRIQNGESWTITR